jgi:hypothetical protein
MRRRATGIRYVWLVCGTAVLALDIVASSASGRRGLGYAALRPVAIVIYFCAGAGGGRLAGIRAGALAGAVTALVDATLGWATAHSRLRWSPSPRSPPDSVSAWWVARSARSGIPGWRTSRTPEAHMRTLLILLALSTGVSSCRRTESAPPPATERERDSIIGASQLPGAQGVRGALRASDSAAARRGREDATGQE